MSKNDTDLHMNTDMNIYPYRYMYMCVCVFVFLLSGAVSCRVSRVVVGWVGGWVWCGVVWCCRHVVVVVIFVIVSWSLSWCGQEEERARKKWREGRSTNSLKSVPVSYDEYIATRKSGAFND